jgi:ribonuclease H2 subunit A
VEAFDRNYGSGYPSDPITQKWLINNFVPIFGYPNITRFSWSTAINAMKAKGLEINYKYADNINEDEK